MIARISWHVKEEEEEEGEGEEGRIFAREHAFDFTLVTRRAEEILTVMQ